MSSFRTGRPWMRSFWVGGAFSALGPGRLTVSLVVVVLLFCHGAFGYVHQLAPVDVQTAPVAHAAGVHQSGPDRAADGLHLGDTYFATLLLLLFGTSLLLGFGVSVGAKLPPVPALRMGGHEARGLPPPRGPTLSYLQVFRL